MLLLAGLLAAGRVASGGITGVVRDQAGAPVPGATITATAIATNAARVIQSTGEGVFTVAGVAPGAYRVDVTLAGFKPVRRDGIRVFTGQTSRVDVVLAVGGVREQVTVTADATALRTDAPSLGAVIDH